MKKCKCCNLGKPLKEFSYSNGKQCKSCYRSKARFYQSQPQHRTKRKVWYLMNVEKLRTYARTYRKVHIDKIRIYDRNYHKTHPVNPEKARADFGKRRALKLNVRHENYTRDYIYNRDNWICGICGRKINKRIKYPNLLSPSIDHIIPLIKGGVDAPVNLQATHLRCNLGKNAINIGQLRMFA